MPGAGPRLRREGGPGEKRRSYLRTPPAEFPEGVSQPGRSGLKGGPGVPGWRGVVIEKPYGTDEVTAEQLDAAVHAHFDEPQVFRIDHDQQFQQNTHIRYQFGKRGPWIGFSWDYQNGLVAGAVGTLEDVLAAADDEPSDVMPGSGRRCPGRSVSSPTRCGPAAFVWPAHSILFSGTGTSSY